MVSRERAPARQRPVAVQVRAARRLERRLGVAVRVPAARLRLERFAEARERAPPAQLLAGRGERLARGDAAEPEEVLALLPPKTTNEGTGMGMG